MTEAPTAQNDEAGPVTKQEKRSLLVMVLTWAAGLLRRFGRPSARRKPNEPPDEIYPLY